MRLLSRLKRGGTPTHQITPIAGKHQLKAADSEPQQGVKKGEPSACPSKHGPTCSRCRSHQRLLGSCSGRATW